MEPIEDTLHRADEIAPPEIAQSAVRAAIASRDDVVEAEPEVASAAEPEVVEAPAPDAFAEVPFDTRIEALLFAASQPLSPRRLQSLLGGVAAADVREAIARLEAGYVRAGRAFGVQEVAGGYQLRTRPDLAPYVARLGRRTDTDRLSSAALETLAVVAYRQPVLRADVEKIRGVASGEMLRTLIEKSLVRVTGRADLPGAPLQYGTTLRFLEVFGLRDLRDLPADRELLQRPL